MSRLRKTICLGGALIAALLLAFTIYAIAPLRRVVTPLSSTKILDRNGGLLYEVTSDTSNKQTFIAYQDLPPIFIKALIASEDARFYSHHGVDLRATLRVLKDIVLEGHPLSGASTLEQQVVKNLYFPDKPRTVIQKAREMIAGVYWSTTHTKQQTIETYVNVTFFGNRTLGVVAASDGYFHKSVADLTLADSALLVGVIPAPSQYDPYHHWSAARTRQREVLMRMLNQGMISESERDQALATDIDIFPPRHQITAPHFVFYVLDELETRYPDIRRGGYTVRTSLDPSLQQFAEQTITRRIASLADQQVSDGALMAMNPTSGEVLAYVGSRNYFDESIQGQVDMVAAKRQPGSALKPFLYFQAFQQGFTSASVIADLPVRFETAENKAYYPRNYGYVYHGPVTIREALSSSLNIPAVKVLSQLGLTSFVNSLRQFGIELPESPDHYGLGLVLGGGETTLADVTRAYASLALYAKSVTPIDVLEVRDDHGVREQASQPKHLPLFPLSSTAEQAAWLVSDVLSDKLARGMSFGAENLLDMGKRVAVKTGTTKDFHDNWAFGYTPELVVGVWVGNADNTPMQGVSGITGAVPILHDVMQSALQSRSQIIWPAVSGIIHERICLPSGKRATDSCGKTRDEPFIVGTQPTESDDWYTQVRIEPRTGFLATPNCQAGSILKTFFHPPPEYDAWFATKGYERLPTQDCEGRRVGSSTAPQILSPLDGDTFERSSLQGSQAMIPFIASGHAGQTFHWKLNGQPFDTPNPIFLWPSQAGDYTLELDGANRSIHFSVP